MYLNRYKFKGKKDNEGIYQQLRRETLNRLFKM